MEKNSDDVKLFFRKLLKTISSILIWLLFFFTIGIRFRLLILDEKITVENIVFFILAIATAAYVAFYNYKLWHR